MKISDILNNSKITVSFEVFPPKKWDRIENTKRIVGELCKSKPAFISVTYGAGGTRAGFTNEIARCVKSCKTTPLSHLTCIASGREKINAELDGLEKEGIENILALRGDIPEGYDFESDADFHHASELITFIKKTHPSFCVGGACYPEGHPESADLKEDIKYLKQKVDCGLDFITTQMFFDNDVFMDFKHRAAAAGINVPIIAGIMPITNAAQIKRSVELSGCSFPQKFKRIIERFGDDEKSMKSAGIIYAEQQITDLIARGQNNIHIYTMNKPDVANTIMSGIADIINE